MDGTESVCEFSHTVVYSGVQSLIYSSYEGALQHLALYTQPGADCSVPSLLPGS